MSLCRRTILFYGHLLASPSPFALFPGRYNGRQKRRSSFGSGKGENLLTITMFGKPLFAVMHHRVLAVAGGTAEAKRCMLAPRGLTGWPVMRSALSSHSTDAGELTFGRPNLFCICTTFFV